MTASICNTLFSIETNISTSSELAILIVVDSNLKLLQKSRHKARKYLKVKTYKLKYPIIPIKNLIDLSCFIIKQFLASISCGPKHIQMNLNFFIWT